MKIACVQTDVVFNNPGENLKVALKKCEEAKANGADLIVFPECFLTGYCVNSPEEAAKIAIVCHCNKDFEVTDCDDSLLALQALAIEQNLHIIIGLAGKDDYGLFNAAVLLEPSGLMRRYIKTHLPCLGFDRFVDPGDALPVFQTDLGTIGILICYDLRPPEATRVLALRGADLIVLPTNWPARKGVSPAVMCPTRAIENKVFFASCNRIGHENGFDFRGESAIIDCNGAILAQAEIQDEIIYAELDLSEARNKQSVIIPGSFESNAMTSRRPELYQDITSS